MGLSRGLIVKTAATFLRIRAKERRPDAGDLQRRYLDTVYAYVVIRIGEGTVAEDVTAEVFVAAFSHLRHCPAEPATPENDPIRAWLLGIARRKVADTLRQRARRTETPLSEDLATSPKDDPESVALRDEAIQILHAILKELPEMQQEALRLKYVDGLSLIEIGTVLQKSPNTVGQLLHRARETVRLRGHEYFGPPYTQEIDHEPAR